MSPEEICRRLGETKTKEIFHSLTVAGFICQYIAASLLIYRAA